MYGRCTEDVRKMYGRGLQETYHTNTIGRVLIALDRHVHTEERAYTYVHLIIILLVIA